MCVFNVMMSKCIYLYQNNKLKHKSGKNIFYWEHAKYSPCCWSKQAYTHTHTYSEQKEEEKKEMRERKREMCLIQHHKYTHLKGTLLL